MLIKQKNMVTTQLCIMDLLEEILIKTHLKVTNYKVVQNLITKWRSLKITKRRRNYVTQNN